MQKIKKILITGSNGAIGISLCKKFKDEDWYVIGTDKHKKSLTAVDHYESINFINIHDPNAVVIIQADHGHYFSEKNSDDIYKIFNLIKVPNYCRNFLSNEIDNINGVRLSLSCATNSKIKLIKRKIYNETEFLN